MIYKLSELENEIKWSTQKTIVFEANIIKLCSKLGESSNEGLEKRIENIEKYLKSGKASANNNYNLNNVNQVQSTSRMVQNTYTTKKVNNTTRKNSKINQNVNFSNKSEEYWPQIISELKKNGKIVLYTNLLGTNAKEINDMTVGIEFPKGMTSFGKTILEKQENIREISNLIS
ncbi:MAG: hypothetical protein J6O41_02520, partial [Clostridia bacterium]|nr:hypothetical protein [Clostridia bacterium]